MAEYPTAAASAIHRAWKSLKRRSRSLALLAVAGALGLVVQRASGADDPNPNAACLECHDDASLTMMRGGKKVSLAVDAKILASSVHSSLACTDCHDGFDPDKQPHASPIKPVDCGSCHDHLGKSHPFHPRLALDPLPSGPDTRCTACHGTHAIVDGKSPLAPGAALRQPALCGQCHQKEKAQFLASAHARISPARAGHTSDSPTCLSCHATAVVAKPGTQPGIALKLAQTRLCESCHAEKEAVADRTVLGRRFIASFERSVHGAALANGNAQSATCVDCHGSHGTNPAMSTSSTVNLRNVAATCGRCHAKEAAAFGASVHASALAKGNLDSPSCTRCHGEHDIKAPSDPASPVYAKNVSQQVCASCHASVRLSKKYGFPADRFQTFSDSYHGLSVRGGAVVVVNCASCHGAHEIRSDKDPLSSVSKARIAQTCGRCHPGANKRFAVGAVHASPESRRQDPLLYWVSTLYVWLIFLVIGSMAVHNALDFLKKIRRKVAIQKGLLAEEPVAHRLYLRMSGEERLQHATLVLSFAMLVVTGFMLRYPEAWWAVAIRHLSESAFTWRGILHRVAGVAMIVAGAWHVGYLAGTPRGRRLFADLLPRRRDLTDPFRVLRYNLGLASEKPRFPRFSYIEKAEYWALIWGGLLMSVTGAILWFDNTSMGLLSKLGFDVARTIHFYEAVLATLAIVVWHFYFVIFNPDVYPMNLSWLTGRMSEREMLEEHPLELERLKKEQAPPEPPQKPGPS